MPTRPLEKELLSQLGLKNELIQGNLNNAQLFPTACLSSMSQKEALRSPRVEALEILNRLLGFVMMEKKKYGCRLAPKSNFYQRHLIIKYFLVIQNKKNPRSNLLTLCAFCCCHF